MKYTKFDDIPQFTQPGSWECDYDLSSLVTFIDELVQGKGARQKLDLNPDFQRGHVWNEAQQIAWIEFFLRGGKTGRVIYLNNPGWQRNYEGEFVLVDGKQRLEAARRFLNNEIPAFGSLFKEYTDKMRLVGATMRLNVNTLQTRREVLKWYIDMNAGGTPHSNDEIRKVQELLEKEPPDGRKRSKH